jgi:serine/threonine protein kinase
MCEHKCCVLYHFGKLVVVKNSSTLTIRIKLINKTICCLSSDTAIFVVVACSGYMSPEYAMRGEFSVKSDVYSFGVLILEIISGKKNNNFYELDGAEDLLTYVSMKQKL